jgi:hypothetical protein
MMAMATHDAGLAIVLPVDVAILIPGAHINTASWAAKKGKESGRQIVDCSAADAGTPLNSPAAKEAGEKRWGKIKHPTIAQLTLMIMEMVRRLMAEEGTTMEEAFADLLLWKTDLKAAFTLLNFNPRDKPL